MEKLYDTYHGVYISVRYAITVDCTRGFMSKNLKHQIEATLPAAMRPPACFSTLCFQLGCSEIAPA